MSEIANGGVGDSQSRKIIGQDEVSTRRGSSKRFIDCPLMPVLEITDDGLVSTVGGTIE